MALRLTQSLTEMSTRNITWGGGVKGGRCGRLTTLPPSCADCLEIWEPQSPGNRRACRGLQWDCFTFYYGLALCRMVGRHAVHRLYVTLLWTITV
jgi:hypothetical protein